MSYPSDLHYTADHEWLRLDGEHATVGVTDYATGQLGDVVYVAPPRVGERLTAGQACGEIESTKSVSDLLCPVDGEVAAVNEAVVDEPGLVNSDPFDTGWLFRLRVTQRPESLLDAAGYAALTGHA